MTLTEQRVSDEEWELPCRRPTTGVPCRECGGVVFRYLTVDGYFKGRGHLECEPCRERIAAEKERTRQAWKASLGHPVTHRYIEGMKVPTSCACGCGTEINADTIEILERRNQGMTYAKIAAELGRNQYGIRQRIRSMPRYAKGHVRQAGREWGDLPCFRCGKPVHTPKNTQFPKCSGRNGCGVGFVFEDDGSVSRTWASVWDEREQLRKERERANFRAADALMAPHRERRRKERYEALLVLRRERVARMQERALEREQRQLERELLRLQRSEERAVRRAEKERDAALIALAKSKAVRPGSAAHWAQLGVVDGELAELLEEQRRDERMNKIQYERSLDVRFDGNDDGSWALAHGGAVAFDRDEDKWPYYAGQGRTNHKKMSV